MAGFDEAGLSGSEYLRDSLGNCNESTLAMFLESFQQDNSILLPSLQQALPLLDLHNIRRYEFHQTVTENLREKLLSRFEVIGNEKLLQLLEQAFPFINVPALRPVVMDMLTRVTTVPAKFIEMLAKEPELYNKCSLVVKRQIWIQHQPLFGDAVGPLLNEYLKDKNSVIFDVEDLTNQDFLSMRPKVRRQHHVVQQLSEMIGKSLQLYNLVLQFLRTLFLRTKEAHYCTLRAELLMAIHDLDVKEIKDVDPCHKFIWCLDACVRSQLIDSNKIKDLRGYMKAAKATEEQVLGDIAMVLCDPFAINVIGKSIIKVLLHLTTTEVLPRTSADLTFLLSLLQLGLGAWAMIESQIFKENLLSNDLIVRFIPIVMATMVEDSVQRVEQKLPNKSKENLELHHSFEQSLSEYSICFTVAFYLALHMAKHKHRQALSSLLPAISSSYNNHVLHDAHLHSLITIWACSQEEFTSAEFCEIVFDHFLLTMLSQESVLRQTLRLLHFVYSKMDSNKVVTILTATQPSPENSEVIHELHSSIVDKVAGSNPSSASLSSLEQPLSASSSGTSASSSPLNYLPPSSV
ncbi:negative elongation factor B-like [Dendronephthya gigantea]|uniref:negative elongation factor B-like n=1 Tax=Dendronephthya gigantea TaxID=151771 RepID=UPI0010699FE9|nr:negative elongation factor B-like [Dendronephthya gigantea]